MGSGLRLVGCHSYWVNSQGWGVTAYCDVVKYRRKQMCIVDVMSVHKASQQKSKKEKKKSSFSYSCFGKCNWHQVASLIVVLVTSSMPKIN